MTSNPLVPSNAVNQAERRDRTHRSLSFAEKNRTSAPLNRVGPGGKGDFSAPASLLLLPTGWWAARP